MIRKSLSADNLRAFLEAVRQTGRCLIAPVREGDLVLFREVPSAEEVLLDYGNTQWPCKEFLFPKTEPILHYRVQGGGKVELAEPELPAQGQVIFGVRPCDAAGLLVLDAVFRWDSEDAFYLHRRERTTIIGLACTEPRPECFCTAVGLSPTGTRGSDLLLTPLDGEFLAEAVTEKGEQLLREHEGFFQDTDLAKEEVTRTVEAKIQRKQVLGPAEGTTGLRPQTPVPDLFNLPVWEEKARKCLQCGVCAFVCPTCHCFDLVDEGNVWGGTRCRNWDSCAFALFTQHASGHNPRPTQPARYRQRVLHKFRYFPERFGLTMCVGCGRCGVHCPVNLDIYEVALSVLRE